MSKLHPINIAQISQNCKRIFARFISFSATSLFYPENHGFNGILPLFFMCFFAPDVANAIHLISFCKALLV
jgi:hypothetical protein